MKGRVLLTIMLLLVSGLAQSQINSLPSQPHLLVKGAATKTVRPDRFSITVQLQATDLSAEEARKRVAADAARVLEAFRKNGARQGNIEASELSMRPEQMYEGRQQVFKGTQVQRSLKATFDSLDAVRACLAELKTSENLHISGVTTAYSGEAELRAKLKQEAVQQTRESAQQLAKAYGTHITGLYAISDVAPSFQYGIQAGYWPQRKSLSPSLYASASAADIGATVEAMEAGDLVIQENVYAVFLIAQ